MIDLQAIFGDGPAAVPVPEAVPQPQVAPPGVDDDVGGRQHDDGGGQFADWVCRPDCHGRMGWQAPGLPEAVPFDALPLPGPACPVCGSLERWQDLLGRQRCGVCEAETLDKAMELAERAARLRQQAQPRKPAPQDCARLRFWRHGRYAGPREQAARTGAATGLVRGVKLGKAGLQKGATVCRPEKIEMG